MKNQKKIKNIFNDPFLNPGKIVTNFAKVVDYLNADECGFKNILKMKKTIDTSYTGQNYGNISKVINGKNIHKPSEIISKIIMIYLLRILLKNSKILFILMVINYYL